MYKTLIPGVLVVVFLTGCERTTVEGSAGKKLTVVKPSDVSLVRGSTENVTILVQRDNFTGPVRVQFAQLPGGVSVVDGGNEIEGMERTFVISANDKADLVENHVATVTVSGPEGMSATEQFELTVKEKS